MHIIRAWACRLITDNFMVRKARIAVEIHSKCELGGSHSPSPIIIQGSYATTTSSTATALITTATAATALAATALVATALAASCE